MLDRLTDKDLELNAALYEAWIREGKPDGWTKEDKARNYRDLVSIESLTGVPILGSSCLDVGCGTGDLSPFLRRIGLRRYLGVDAFEPALVLARQKYPDEEFIFGDFLTVEFDEQFDFAFLSGAISIELESDNNAFVRAMVAKMWRLTRVGLAMNFLIPYNSNYTCELGEARDYNMIEIEQLCREAVPEAVIGLYECNKNLYQANIYVYRPDFMT